MGGKGREGRGRGGGVVLSTFKGSGFRAMGLEFGDQGVRLQGLGFRV